MVDPYQNMIDPYPIGPVRNRIGVYDRPYGISYRPYCIDPYPETIGVCIGVYGKFDRPYIDPYPRPTRPLQKEVFMDKRQQLKRNGRRSNPLSLAVAPYV